MDVNSVNLEHLVIDSGAIIRGQGFNYFNCSKKFWTVQEVLGEIRDSRARRLLDSLPFEIEVRSPTDRAMRAVVEFARQTGDLGQLSMVDLKVLALTYDLEVETNGTRFIRTEPKRSIRPPPTPAPAKAANAAPAKPVQEHESCECCPVAAAEETSGADGAWSLAGARPTKESTPAPREAAAPAAVTDTANVESISEIMHNDSEDTDSCVADNDAIDTVERDPLTESGILEDVSAISLGAEKEPAPEFNMEEDAFPTLGGPVKAKEPAETAAPGSWANALRKEKPKPTAVPASAPVVIVPSAKPAAETAEKKAVPAASANTDHSAAAPSTSRIMRSTGAAEYSSGQSNQFRAEEDDGENWISPGNITSARATGQGMLGGGRSQGVTSTKVLSSAKVACVTTDFSMENVVLQMGMKLLSVEGRLIHRVKQWVLRCAACRTIHYDVDRLFCSKCGVNMLQRIACSTDSKTGELKLHLKANYQPNTRGMVHSLPKAGTQGRYDGELLLREDQLLTGIWRQKIAKIKHDVKSAFGEDITGDVGLNINKREYGVKVGLGRRNPNADKGRERRGKKKKSH